MFNKHRFLILAGLVAIICLMFLYRQLSMSPLLDNESASNEALAEIFFRVTWPDYHPLLQPAGAPVDRAPRLPY